MSIWHTIEKSIQRSGYPDFVQRYKQAATGGDISQSYVVSDHKNQFFVKLNSFEFINNFKQEVIGLSYLSRCSDFVVPRVIAIDKYEEQSFLILQYLQLCNDGDVKVFALALAKLHEIKDAKFGFEANNFIGSNAQINNRCSDWGKFFVEQRLLFQYELLLHKSFLNSEISSIKSNFETLMQRCLPLLNSHSPKPSLVHGDLWQGNYAYTNDGEPVIYDPACYYADREVDIAMLELFGFPTIEFYDYYYQLHPKIAGEAIRKQIYNLYHLLNHANLFGQSYCRQASASIESLLKLI